MLLCTEALQIEDFIKSCTTHKLRSIYRVRIQRLLSILCYVNFAHSNFLYQQATSSAPHPKAGHIVFGRRVWHASWPSWSPSRFSPPEHYRWQSPSGWGSRQWPDQLLHMQRSMSKEVSTTVSKIHHTEPHWFLWTLTLNIEETVLDFLFAISGAAHRYTELNNLHRKQNLQKAKPKKQSRTRARLWRIADIAFGDLHWPCRYCKASRCGPDLPLIAWSK